MKALCVFSGGLDSMLAVEVVRAQGIEVQALFFETPFFGSKKAVESARAMGLPLRVLDLTDRHMEVVRAPRHGYGGNMNPCIDCHALMFRAAGERLSREGADFVITGEVLGQRPMSQNRNALDLVASESGIAGLLLRPLSARLLPATVPEKEGWVKRDLLMDFQGRSRKPQMALADKLGIPGYPSPGGGCLLTEKAFSRRLKDLLFTRPHPGTREIELLKLGRHFRTDSGTKLVVGRNRRENEAIRGLSGGGDVLLSTRSTPGPTVLVSGAQGEESLHLAARITGAYSDAATGETVAVRVEADGEERVIRVRAGEKGEFRRFML